MNNPFWFNIIQQWKEMGKGAYGVTFPFLVGAVAIHVDKEPDGELVAKVFDDMKNNPVDGYYCEVRWCGNIDEPVVSVNRVENASKVSIKADCRVGDTISIGFTTDLTNMFHLDCETSDECLAKLFSYTEKIIRNNTFTKNRGQFTAFTNGDIDFIKSVQELKST
jgi:hypothetical protein